MISCSLTLTGCGGSKLSKEESAKQYLEQYFNATIEDPSQTLQKYANLLDKYNILEDSTNLYTCNILKYSLRNMSYQIISIEGTGDTSVSVNVKIRAKNIGETLVSDDNLTDCITKATIMEENDTDYETFNSKIVEIITDNIAEDKIKPVSSDVVINMEYTDGKWHVIVDEFFLNAIYGGISQYDDKLLTQYIDMPTIEEPLTATTEPEPNTTTPSEGTTQQTTATTVPTETGTKPTSRPTEPSESQVSEQTTSSPSESTSNTTPDKIEVVYITDEDEFFNYELKPNDTEYKNLSETNKTSRTSRKNPIELGEAGVYDNTDYFAAQSRYGLELTITEVIKGEAAKEKLSEAGESVPIADDEMCILIKVQLVLKVNSTGKESVKITYLDFDMLNYKNSVQKTFKLKNLPQFSELSEESPQTEGYLCFKYKKGDNVNLAFKESADNTLWFSVVKK